MATQTRPCSVPGCNNKTSRRHYFTTTKYQKIWVERINNDKLRTVDVRNATICAEHFDKECIGMNGRLLKGSLPTLNLPGYKRTAGDHLAYLQKEATVCPTPGKYEIVYTEKSNSKTRNPRTPSPPIPVKLPTKVYSRKRPFGAYFNNEHFNKVKEEEHQYKVYSMKKESGEKKIDYPIKQESETFIEMEENMEENDLFIGSEISILTSQHPPCNTIKLESEETVVEIEVSKESDSFVDHQIFIKTPEHLQCNFITEEPEETTVEMDENTMENDLFVDHESYVTTQHQPDDSIAQESVTAVRENSKESDLFIGNRISLMHSWVRSCCVPGCLNTTSRRYYFTTTSKCQKLWLERINNKKLYTQTLKSVTICETHFEKECIGFNGRLLKGSLPTLNLPGYERKEGDQFVYSLKKEGTGFVTPPKQETIKCSHKSQLQRSSSPPISVKLPSKVYSKNAPLNAFLNNHHFCAVKEEEH